VLKVARVRTLNMLPRDLLVFKLLIDWKRTFPWPSKIGQLLLPLSTKVENKNASDRLLEARILEVKSEDIKLPLTERTEAQSKALLLRRQFRLATEFDII